MKATGGLRSRGREQYPAHRRRAMAGVVSAAMALALYQAVPTLADGEHDAPAADAPAAEGPDKGSEGDGASSEGRGFGYGGRATAPSPLPLLEEDPAYPVPEPLQRDNLPEAVDEVPGWQSNVFCDPVDRPGMVAFANLIGAHYDRPGYTTSRTCINLKSEHYDGRAVDWQLDAHDPADRRIGDAAVTWLTENDGEMAKRFGIQSIIWNKHVWRAYESEVGWRGYVGQSPHTDHVHFSFTWDGAAMRTSWWTGIPVEMPDLGPCAAPAGQSIVVSRAPRYAECAPLPVPQDASASGESGEEADSEEGDGEGAAAGDGTTGGESAAPEVSPVTPSATPDFMETAFTPFLDTTVAEGDTGDAVVLLQSALGVEPDGIFGPKTAAALEAYTEEHPALPTSAETDALTWLMLEREAYPTLPVRSVQLEIGDEGPAVALLQQQYGLEPDGIFGPMTQQAVLDAQVAAGLPATGVVDGATWQASDVGAGGQWGVSEALVDARGFTWVNGVIELAVSDLPLKDQ